MNNFNPFVRGNVRILTTLFFLAGIDGFQLFSSLRELGARPFYIIYLLVFIFLVGRKVVIRTAPFAIMIIVVSASTAGFLLSGINFPDFGEKHTVTQFSAQGILFVLGLSPLLFSTEQAYSDSDLRDAILYAMIGHVMFILVDATGIYFESIRFFEGSFLGLGENRPFPTGLFSEPSYVGAYFGILLPAFLYNSSFNRIVVVSFVAASAFYFGEVRTFFAIYPVGILTLITLKFNFSWRAILLIMVLVPAFAVLAASLGIVAVGENLSSAYRLGSSLAYFQYALNYTLLLGEGFGSSHFIFPMLDHSSFLSATDEFSMAMAGGGFRIPVFNLWIRLMVEAGILPTLLLLYGIGRGMNSKFVHPVAKILLSGSLIFSLASDSYVYGLFTLSVLLSHSMKVIMRRHQSDSCRTY